MKVPYSPTTWTQFAILGCMFGTGSISAAVAPARDAEWAWPSGRLETDLTPLPVLDSSMRAPSNIPRIGAFVRSTETSTDESDLVGHGGVDLQWNLDDLIDVAVVVGAAMEIDPAADDERTAPAFSGRSTAFDGFDFGGRSGRDANPFDLNAALGRRADREDLDATFLAARAAFRPGEDTSIGLVATASSDTAGFGLVGIDLTQRVRNHEIRAWVQQRTGLVDTSEESDRSAFGASIGGRIDALRYEFDWRRIGDGFESDLGSVRAPGSQAMGGRFAWGLDFESSKLFKRLDVGVRGRFESDLDLLDHRIDFSLDSLALTVMSGDRFVFGVDQSVSTSVGATRSEASRFSFGWTSSDRLPIQIGNELSFASREDAPETTWRTRTRWRAGYGVNFTSHVDWSQSENLSGRESRLNTGVGADVAVDATTVARASIDLDSVSEVCSIRQSIGWRLGSRSEFDVAIEQRVPTSAIDRGSEIRARIGGRITF